MKKYDVVVGVGAQQDLVDIFEYISSVLENPSAATKICDAIIDKCYNLSVFPELSPICFTELGIDFRISHYKKYLIVYYIDKIERVVKIRNIVYSKRNFLR